MRPRKIGRIEPSAVGATELEAAFPNNESRFQRWAAVRAFLIPRALSGSCRTHVEGAPLALPFGDFFRETL
jgi:hypothetical protein